jgi:CheY-like chemotaxis protein
MAGSSATEGSTSRKLGADVGYGFGPSPILVVDDEEMVRNLACTILKKFGHDVLEAANGRDALRVLADSQAAPSLMLLDLDMPVMSGQELVPILEQEYPRLKIILTSGYPKEKVAGNLSAGAIAGFLQKPYTVTSLMEKVNWALGRPASTGHNNSLRMAG